jgi:hypothetical protein
MAWRGVIVCMNDSQRESVTLVPISFRVFGPVIERIR